MKIDNVLKNISDQIVEAQVKLGYAKETMRLYYPLASLNNIIDEAFPSGEALVKSLSENKEFTDSTYGKLTVSSRNDRVEITVSPQAVEYIHENIKPTQFLTDIINLFMTNHHCDIDEIKEVFEKYSDDYVCEEMKPGTDFDYAIHFKDSSIDDYYYCIKMEMGHSIYHRFTKEDYEMLL